MKKAAILFLMAVILPAFLLGYLSLQSARQQEVLIESQEARLRQQQVDALAGQVALAVRVEHESFMDEVKNMMAGRRVDEVATEFNTLLQQNWNRRSVGFSIRENGGILSPRVRQPESNPSGPTGLTEKFIHENAEFLRGTVAADVYATSNDSLLDVQQELVMKQQASYPSKIKMAEEKQGRAQTGRAQSEAQLRSRQSKDESYQQSSSFQIKRNVTPQRYDLDENKAQMQPDSTLNVARSTFSDLTIGKESGIVTRFVNDRLEMLFWMRPEAGDSYILGARVLPEDLRDVVEQVINQSGFNTEEITAAVLDDRTRPFVVYPQAKDQETSSHNWSQPFVASEIGEMLPHWEVALYLTDPARLTQAAQVSSWTISGLIVISLGAIAAGGSLLLLDTRRQLELVKKKTDFVSNVSHELKTPLTSIRMFAELLREKRVRDEDKVNRYLDIITVEAERLTRLINNVLDFSRMERKEKIYHKKPLDLYELLKTVWSGQELHLQQEGFTTHWHAQDGPYPVTIDADAIAQVLVNLISNAEKYSGADKEIEIHSYLVEREVRITVMDRGIGVPPGDEKKIFEHFYRAHDSLASGIQGSGLGLTLAARIAADHGGSISFERRDGGGSRFSLQLPLSNSDQT